MNSSIVNLLESLEKRPNFKAIKISDATNSNDMLQEIFSSPFDLVTILSDYVVAIKNGKFTHIVNMRDIKKFKVVLTCNEQYELYSCFDPFFEGLSKARKYFSSSKKFTLCYDYRLKKYDTVKEGKTVLLEELNRTVKFLLLKNSEGVSLHFFHKFLEVKR